MKVQNTHLGKTLFHGGMSSPIVMGNGEKLWFWDLLRGAKNKRASIGSGKKGGALQLVASISKKKYN